MRYAAHQANYFPWLGYFHKLAVADVFVILDDVQFTKGGYQNRVQIKTAQGPQWLTAPILHSGRGPQSANTVAYDETANWRSKHIKKIQANYGRAAYAGDFLPHLSGWIGDIQGDLSTANASVIERVAALLGLTCKIIYSSSLGLQTSGGERIVDIGRALGADAYLSGSGARKYQNADQFARAGITLRYISYSEPVRPQLWGDFTGGISIIDALLNVGVKETARIVRCSP